MAMFGPAGQNAVGFGQGLASLAQSGGRARPAGGSQRQLSFMEGFYEFNRNIMARRAAYQSLTPFERMMMAATGQNLDQAMAAKGTTSRQQVVSPGQTQVIRPSQQQAPARRQGPAGGAASSLLVTPPSGDAGSLGMTTLLGG